MRAFSTIVPALLCGIFYSGTVTAASAGFYPNILNAGESTTFIWDGKSGFDCSVDGLPSGPIYHQTRGSITFIAQTSLTAALRCEISDGKYSRVTAQLTVVSGLPTVTASYSPSTVSPGQNSTLSWSSTNAANCSSAQNSSVIGKSGSLSVPAATTAGSQTTTISCTGPAGTTSQSATLTTVPPRPTVSMSASPWVIYAPTQVFFSWNSFGATYCNLGGTAGFFYRNVDYFTTGTYSVTCTGPGGSTTAYTHVYWNGPLLSQTSNTLLSKNSTTISANGAIPDLKHLGIDLAKKRMKFVKGDLNTDGFEDLLVLDPLQEKAFIVLGKAGKYPAINKSVAGVTSLDQIKSIQISPQGAAGDITVIMENRQ